MDSTSVSGLFSYEIEAQYEKQPDFPIITFDNGFTKR